MSKIKILRRSFFVVLLLGVFAPMCMGFSFLKSATGNIKINPSLGSLAVKNGETLKISAEVDSISPIVFAKAKIEEADVNIPLHLSSGNTKVGVWVGDWKAVGLREQNYKVTLTFIDAQGFVQTNTDLSFTDPIFGQSQIGEAKIMSRVNSLQGRLTDRQYQVGVIDSTGTFGYYGTNTLPGRIIKINLATSTRVSELTLNAGEGNLTTVVMDPTGTFGYFAGGNKIIKVNLSTMTRVG